MTEAEKYLIPGDGRTPEQFRDDYDRIYRALCREIDDLEAENDRLRSDVATLSRAYADD